MLAPVDVEADLVSAMTSLAVPIATAIPNPRPASWVRVTRAGGGRANLVQEQPLLIIECWAPESVAAFTLASAAWALLDARYGEDGSLSAPSWFPDPDSGTARYQFTAQPFVRLAES